MTTMSSDALADGRGLAPKYARLKDELLALISSVPPGSLIHTERELCERYGVSRTTVRQALQELVHEGYLFRRQGKGTFVATHTEEKTSNFRFLRIRRNDGQPVRKVAAALMAGGANFRPGGSIDGAQVIHVAPGQCPQCVRRARREHQ